MSVIESSVAVNAVMAIRNEGRRLGLRSSLRPQFDLWLDGFGFAGTCKGPSLERSLEREREGGRRDRVVVWRNGCWI